MKRNHSGGLQWSLSRTVPRREAELQVRMACNCVSMRELRRARLDRHWSADLGQSHAKKLQDERSRLGYV